MLPPNEIAHAILVLPFTPRRAMQRLLDGNSLLAFVVSVVAALATVLGIAVLLADAPPPSTAPAAPPGVSPWQAWAVVCATVLVYVGALWTACNLLGGYARIGRWHAQLGEPQPWFYPVLCTALAGWVIAVVAECIATVQGFSLIRAGASLVMGYFFTQAAIFLIAIASSAF